MPQVLVYVPATGQPRQLFVLLHGGAGRPDELAPLTQAVKLAFPQAVIVLPWGPLASADGTHHWFEQSGLSENNYVERVRAALPPLVGYIRQVQAKYGLTGEHTALAGFGHGATLALEASLAQEDLAGRVLAFSGNYARLPGAAPVATTVHLLHGADDPVVPVADMRSMHGHLADLRGDATLDIASNVGHELHEALVRQAIVRLQTCIPLRSWQAALGHLENPDSSAGDPDAPASRGTPEGPTLH